jgi:hypothetical protein
MEARAAEEARGGVPGVMLFLVTVPVSPKKAAIQTAAGWVGCATRFSWLAVAACHAGSLLALSTAPPCCAVQATCGDGTACAL